MKLSQRAKRIKERGQGERRGRGGLITIAGAARKGSKTAETSPETSIDRTDQTLTELYADSSESLLNGRAEAMREAWDALVTVAEMGSERNAAEKLGVTRYAIRKLREQSRQLDHDAALQLAKRALGEFDKTAPQVEPCPDVPKTIFQPTIRNIPGVRISEAEKIKRELKHWPFPENFDAWSSVLYLPKLRQWAVRLRQQGKITHAMLLNGEIVSTLNVIKPNMVGVWRILGGGARNQNS